MTIQLTDEQQKIVDEAVYWYRNSSSTLFEIAGYAGTGKSVTLGAIIKALHLDPNVILPMAYTGQACTIMRKRGMPQACTCHSGLFYPTVVNEFDEHGRLKINPKFNTPITRVEFIPKSFENTHYKLIVLDEAWMIPKSFRKFIDATGIKVIACGDPGQLPPIREEPGYLTGSGIHFLTKLMRQSENSPITWIADSLRNGRMINTGFYGDPYGSSVLVMFDDELDLNMIARADAILTPTNRIRNQINQTVRRDIIHTDTDYPLFGERIICRRNDWNFEVDGMPLVNGLTGRVVSPVSVTTYNGKTFKLDFKADMINTPFYQVEINRQYLNTTDPKEKQAIEIDRYTRGDLFEYAYASTVHLAQGSEYENGIYLESYFGKNAAEINALNYTAVTRFKNKLIIALNHTNNIWRL